MPEVKKGQLWEELHFNWKGRSNALNCETTIWYLLSDPYPYTCKYDYGYEKEVDAISLSSTNFKIQAIATRLIGSHWRLISE